jgi:segregation and condensation protein B
MSGMRKKRKERARAEQAADLESPELIEALDGEVEAADAEGEAEAVDAEEGDPVDGESEEDKVERVTRIVEALLFASDRPLTLQRLKELTHQRTTRRIEAGLVVLKEDYEGRGIVLHEVAGGWQFRTAPECSEWVQQLVAGRPVRLSRAQLETLAIIAYRQPITRPEIDDIRGVDSSGTLHVLLDRNLVRVLGKKEEPGRPLLYGTTKEFLEFFNLSQLRDLPTLREFHELSEESMREVERLTAETDALEQQAEQAEEA